MFKKNTLNEQTRILSTSKIDNSVNYSLDELKKILVESYKSIKVKKVKDPNAEKRAPSAYNLFIKDQITNIKKSNPEMNNKQIMAKAADLWREHKEAKS
jgi:hypothetical protein